MPKKLKSIDVNNLPPLRVWGVDYVCNEVLVEIFQRSTEVEAPRWLHYPLVCANKHKMSENSNDLRVCARNFGLDDSRRSINRNRSTGFQSTDSQQEVLEAAIALLVEYFVRCARSHPRARYFTPSQFIRCVVESDEKSQENGLLNLRADEGYLSLRLEVASSELRSKVVSVLHMLRELAYRSATNAKAPPPIQISLLGQSAAQLGAPVPYTTSDPPLELGPTVAPELRQVRLDKPMHSLAVGASGVGKTHSFIVPRLKAHLAYKLTDGTTGTALIVDPKRELADIAEDFLESHGEANRIFVAGRDGRLRLFPRDTRLSLHDRISLVLDSYGMNANHHGDSATWTKKSVAFLMNLVDAHAITYNLSGVDLFNFLLEAAGLGASPLSKYWHGLRDVVRLLQGGTDCLQWMHHMMLSLAETIKVPTDQRASFQLLARYASMNDDGVNQISYVTGGLEHLLTSMCDEGLTAWIDLCPVPEMSAAQDNATFDLKQLIDESRVIVFQPNDSPSHDVGTCLLKAQFYRAAMGRRNLRQPVLYLADEFQRFITSDRESGEASFLDRCRAYRITVVLATQSVTALHDALSKRKDSANPMAAVDCIVSNISHLFYFQTLDSASTNLLTRGIPTRPLLGWEHPLNLVPLSNLRVGEAYFLAPEGRWGRTQFKLAA